MLLFSLSNQLNEPVKEEAAQISLYADLDEKSETTMATGMDESGLIDTSKMACLLCKRRFDSIEILNKHVLKSDLHKVNFY